MVIFSLTIGEMGYIMAETKCMMDQFTPEIAKLGNLGRETKHNAVAFI